MALVQLKPKALRRFYEPFLLYSALADVLKQQAGRLSTTGHSFNPKNEEEKFHRFVYKLAMNDAGVEYVFGCNEIKPKQLNDTVTFVRKILDAIAGQDATTVEDQPATLLNLLTEVVYFNQERIRLYIQGLRANLKDCIEVCGTRLHEHDDLIKEGLQNIHNACESSTIAKNDRDTCVDVYLKYLGPLKAFVSPVSGSYHLVTERVREAKTMDGKSSECWPGLQHFVSRLIAYDQAVRTFVEAHKQWPEVFKDYEVTGIPSSDRLPQNLGGKSLVASNIVGRMTADVTDQTLFRRLTTELQMIDLDDRLRELVDKGLRTTIHSEILVSDWISQRAGRSELRFFNNWRYIGASKPTCRLCKDYFDAQAKHLVGPSRKISVRPSHGNLYLNWRLPDIFESQGPAAVQHQMRIINTMTQSIRQDTFDIILEKRPVGKRHDTNTYSVFSMPAGESAARADDGGRTDTEELEEMFARDLAL